MNNKYRTADLADINLVAANHAGSFQHRQHPRQKSISLYEEATEKRIEDMLQSHSRYYIYCE